MLFAFGTVLLAASAFAAKNCTDIKLQSEGNCPSKGYECDQALGITTYVENSNWNTAEITCTDKETVLTARHTIVDKLRCRKGKWAAQGDDWFFTTTSAVCAKACGLEVCPAEPLNHPNQYNPLNIQDATEQSKCAFAKCTYGFVALHSNGSLIGEFSSSTQVTCSGSGVWSVADNKYNYLMCKKKPNPCSHKCNEEPWTLPNLEATSAATGNGGCVYSCPPNEVLSRIVKADPPYAIAQTNATCTRRGFLVDNDKIVNRIGCITCDYPNGPVTYAGPLPPVNHPAISKNCVAACPKDTKLRFELGRDSHFAKDNVIYRQFVNENVTQWVTNDGIPITQAHRIECVTKQDCIDWDDNMK